MFFSRKKEYTDTFQMPHLQNPKTIHGILWTTKSNSTSPMSEIHSARVSRARHKKKLPRKLSYPLKNAGWKTVFLLKWFIFRWHVNFRGRCFFSKQRWGVIAAVNGHLNSVQLGHEFNWKSSEISCEAFWGILKTLSFWSIIAGKKEKHFTKISFPDIVSIV